MDTPKSTIDEIHRRVGRNLLAFQTIEQSLRFMLPYIHPEGAQLGPEAMREYGLEHVTGKSLGLLIGQFTEAVSGDKDIIEQELRALVGARNLLVHHFHHNEHFNFMSTDGAATALAYLDEQHELFRTWVALFRAQSAAVLLALAESNPSVAAQIEQYRERLIAQL